MQNLKCYACEIESCHHSLQLCAGHHLISQHEKKAMSQSAAMQGDRMSMQGG